VQRTFKGLLRERERERERERDRERERERPATCRHFLEALQLLNEH